MLETSLNDNVRIHPKEFSEAAIEQMQKQFGFYVPSGINRREVVMRLNFRKFSNHFLK